ncbi:hypothetical protein RHMOL_Rhmol10G0289800 [Rhododendron molle]|uniref:Uncharacterized protein n=1 Tax=Rhododendron molle TaxID=49168 RepID=A0ACC0M744_RHOML|nr:hypothetical protein RHMOL_Rhmol10G0289800 [Rhododendron molle]
MRILALISLSLLSILGALAQHEQCGSQAGGIVCPGGLCCSRWGFCGTTPAYCGDGCQSNCPSPPPPPPPPTSPPPPPPASPPPPPPHSGGGEQCGSQAGGIVCPGGLCCSRWGFCGTTPAYCGDGCQSNCPAPPPPVTPPPPASPPPPPSPSGGGDISSLISKALFEKLLPNRNDPACEGNGFYTYEAFIAAAKDFSGFGTTGDDDTKKREIVAFLAQTSHETTGGWATAPGGPYAWGYCFVTERYKGDYCVPSQQWPCAPGKQYYGRGPIQISYNYNYGPAGIAIGSDLLANPDLVAADVIIAFKAALWFWMTPQYSKPSCHDVITGQWTPSAADSAAGRVPGYGVITNIINGGLECGQGFSTAQQVSRIGYLMHFSDIVGVGYGENLDCNNQRPFG